MLFVAAAVTLTAAACTQTEQQKAEATADKAGDKLDAAAQKLGAKVDAADARLNAKMAKASTKLKALGKAVERSAAETKANVKEAAKD